VDQLEKVTSNQCSFPAGRRLCGEAKGIRMAKKQSKLETKFNEFSRVTFLDETGKPKSAAWLYSFLIGLLLAIVYAAVFIGSGLLFGRWFPEPTLWVILLQYLATAVIGSVPGILLAVLLQEEHKALAYYAYIWIAILVLLTLPATLLMSDWKNGYGWTDMWMFCIYLFFPAILSILAGGIPARLLWNRELEKKRAAERKAKSRPSYYNT